MKKQISKFSQWYVLALVSALALVGLSGCGDMNDNPIKGMSVRIEWPAQGGGFAPLLAGSTDPALPVVSVAAGGVVISRGNPYLDAEVNPADMDALADDVAQSAKFFVIGQASTMGDLIDFPIPPPSASPNWQIAAVALRYNAETLMDIVDLNQTYDDVPTWFGFDARGFLGGVVLPGDEVGIQMQPACLIPANNTASLCQ